MATIKTSEIKKEAKEIINKIFAAVIIDNDKEKWKSAMVFIDKKIVELENGERGFEMFAWQEVKKEINRKFGAKFITKK